MSFLSALLETQEFATLPPVATRVLEMLENENSDVRDLAKIIEADPSLTLKLLRVANSPLYATRTDIKNIQQAIVTLGLNRLTNIVLGVSIFSRFLMSSQKQAAEIMQKFWWHSACTGIVAKSLANKISSSFKEIEFIGGLLHDIGKLAMVQYDTGKYLQVIELVEQKGMMDITAESEVYGVNHLEVGAEIAKMWKLPKDLTTIISSHNYPDQVAAPQDIVAVVRYSDILCEIWGADVYEGFKTVDLSEEISWKVLCENYPDLKDLDIEVFTFELEEDFRVSTDFLNILTKD